MCSFFCWSFVVVPTVLCVLHAVDGQRRPLATRPCVQLHCDARCRPRKRQRAHDEKANRLGPVTLLWLLSGCLAPLAAALPRQKPQRTSSRMANHYWTGPDGVTGKFA
ncbi:hypothetical protein V8C34DRAFT_114974 [Trichoderma compactum]